MIVTQSDRLIGFRTGNLEGDSTSARFCRDILLLELQRLWPRWELKLLLSLGSERPSSADSPSSALSSIAWAFNALASNLSSFAGYVSREHGKDLWAKACERQSDEAISSPLYGSSKVMTVRGTQSWRLRSTVWENSDRPAKNALGRPSRDALRQSIASLVLMSERGPSIGGSTRTGHASDEEAEEIQQKNDRARQIKRRLNLLHLHPAESRTMDHDKGSMWELARKVKHSMQQMELDANGLEDEEEEDCTEEDMSLNAAEGLARSAIDDEAGWVLLA